jgi:16S rRNA (cytosine1402-N4)-methyltransferase
VPVLLQESIEALDIKPQGVYVDVTFGAGGHSRSILEKLDAKGHLYSFDKDEDVRRNLVNAANFTFIHADFRYIHRFLRYYNVSKVDGILADLGVSSFQLDTSDRGFGYMSGGELNMRMNKGATITAATILNTYPESDLVAIFSEYGEVRNSRTLARRIVSRRKVQKFATIQDFIEFLSDLIIGQRSRYLAQVFQALRIEVNQEMTALQSLLEMSVDFLKPGGRLVVMSFHSLEDRIVKRFMKSGNVAGDIERDMYGKPNVPFKLINKKVIVASEEEQELNSRSKSAKLRIAEKLQ